MSISFITLVVLEIYKIFWKASSSSPFSLNQSSRIQAYSVPSQTSNIAIFAKSSILDCDWVLNALLHPFSNRPGCSLEYMSVVNNINSAVLVTLVSRLLM